MTQAVLERPTETSSIPTNWEVSKLSDICLVNPSGGVDLSDDTPVTFLPMPAVEELTGKIDVSISRPYGEVKKGYTRFQENDVLFAKITPCMENGKVAIAKGLMNGFGCGSTEFHVLRPYSGIDEEFVRYYVVQNRFRNNAQSNMSGTAGQKRVPSDFMKHSEIPVPPTNEQKRIVSKIEELFSQLDDGEAALKRAQKLVAQYRQSVLKAAVTGELTQDWREKHQGELESGEALLQRILNARREAWEQAELAKLQAKGKAPKDDSWKKKYPEPKAPDTANLPELPEGWSWLTLDTLAEITGGVTVDAKRKVENGTTVPYLRVANVQRGYLDLKIIKEIEVSQEVFQALKLQAGDILFNEGGDIDKLGRGWIWSDEIENCIHQNHVFRARCYVKDIPGKFISWYANIMAKQYFISEGKQTTNLASISLTKLKVLPIPVPSLAELTEIVSRVENTLSSNEYYLQLLQSSYKRSAMMRQSILKSAFSGQLVPQDPDDEPASELLKRIALERNYSSSSDKPKAAKRKSKRLKE